MASLLGSVAVSPFGARRTGVTEVAERQFMRRFLAESLHRQQVGQQLRGTDLVGEAVPHLHVGEVRSVLQRFLAAELRTRRVEAGDVTSLVMHGHFEGAAGAGRVFV
jgi:hypothetical protein